MSKVYLVYFSEMSTSDWETPPPELLDIFETKDKAEAFVNERLAENDIGHISDYRVEGWEVK